MKTPDTWLLDGWLGSPWRLKLLARRLEERGLRPRIWDYDASGRQSLEILASLLVRRLESTDSPVNLVGFSMGGIVIREALRQNPNLPVSRIACLNSPHQGTLPAHFFSRSGVKELRCGSPFLQRLNAVPCRIPFLNVWCAGDLVVIPGWNACQEHATEEFSSWIPAHAWPLISKNLHQKIASFLRPALSPPLNGRIQCLQSA